VSDEARKKSFDVKIFCGERGDIDPGTIVCRNCGYVNGGELGFMSWVAKKASGVPVVKFFCHACGSLDTCPIFENRIPEGLLWRTREELLEIKAHVDNFYVFIQTIGEKPQS